MEYTVHASVLLEESVKWVTENVVIDNGQKAYFADLTFGGGGHSFALLSQNDANHVIATDQDPDAIKNGLGNIQSHNYQDRIQLFYSNFENLPSIIKENFPSFPGFKGIVIDLGVSSHHFDTSSRGFSFIHEGKLDMRMNHGDDSLMTAADILNSYEAEDLQRIFWNYGEERFSKRIANAVVERRCERPLETTSDLEDIVFHCYPKNMRFKGKNPSTKVFQALRIEVNRELEVLEKSLAGLANLLAVGGRMAIISFHSIEDRIVKHGFKKLAGSEHYKILTKKPIIPSEHEINVNKRSRSAKMRVIERV